MNMTKSSTAARFAPAARNVTAEDEREAPFEKGASRALPENFETGHGTRYGEKRLSCVFYPAEIGGQRAQTSFKKGSAGIRKTYENMVEKLIAGAE